MRRCVDIYWIRYVASSSIHTITTTVLKLVFLIVQCVSQPLMFDTILDKWLCPHTRKEILCHQLVWTDKAKYRSQQFLLCFYRLFCCCCLEGSGKGGWNPWKLAFQKKNYIDWQTNFNSLKGACKWSGRQPSSDCFIKTRTTTNSVHITPCSTPDSMQKPC